MSEGIQYRERTERDREGCRVSAVLVHCNTIRLLSICPLSIRLSIYTACMRLLSIRLHYVCLFSLQEWMNFSRRLLTRFEQFESNGDASFCLSNRQKRSKPVSEGYCIVLYCTSPFSLLLFLTSGYNSIFSDVYLLRSLPIPRLR